MGCIGLKCDVRLLNLSDFEDAVALYRVLVGDIPVPGGAEGEALFSSVLAHNGTYLIGAEVARRIRSMATLHILPNMTFGARPYALVENVVTDAGFREQGLSRAVMERTIEMAWSQDAYKVMLLTGRALGAKGFYQKLGFTSDEKYGMTLRRAPARQPRF